MRYILALATALSVFAFSAPIHANEADFDPFEAAIVATELIGPDSTHEYGSVLLESTREDIAEFVGEMIGVEPERLEEAWADAPLDNQAALFAGIAQLGNRYRYASSNPERGLDCSGFTRYSWGRAGVEIPSNSRRQIRAAQDVEEPMAGDLVYYPGHVMMYLGVDNHIIHSANRRKGVVFGTIHKSVSFGRPG